jgi:putative intracellular protease/amidase
MKIMDTLRDWNEPMIDEWAEKLGAKCEFFHSFTSFESYKSGAETDKKSLLTVGYGADERAPGVWDDYHIVDGRLVTGMNPQSAKSTAKAAVEAFEKL